MINNLQQSCSPETQKIIGKNEIWKLQVNDDLFNLLYSKASQVVGSAVYAFDATERQPSIKNSLGKEIKMFIFILLFWMTFIIYGKIKCALLPVINFGAMDLTFAEMHVC